MLELGAGDEVLVPLYNCGSEIAIDPTWIDVAYTSSWPDSNWKEWASGVLEEHNIYQTGRFARWASGMSQGIAHLLRDGLMMGLLLKRRQRSD